MKKQKKPIELYYWPTPNGWKISIMLEECKIPYVLKPVNIGKGDQFKPKFLKISPNNRMPAIIDPDGPAGKPISVFESGAILQYLGRKSGKFYPKNERDRVKVDEWIYWQMCGLGPMAGQAHHFRQYAPKKIKMAITGKGTASKEQVAAMLKSLLKIKELPKQLDATDGLAAAVCHLFQKGVGNKERSYSGWGSFLKNNPDRLK